MSETKLVCRGCGGVCGQQTEHGRIVDRERRRIRREQRAEYHWIEQAMGNYHGGSCHCMRCEAGRALIRIDAATRAKKGKRK